MKILIVKKNWIVIFHVYRVLREKSVIPQGTSYKSTPAFIFIKQHIKYLIFCFSFLYFWWVYITNNMKSANSHNFTNCIDQIINFDYNILIIYIFLIHSKIKQNCTNLESSMNMNDVPCTTCLYFIIFFHK